MKIDLEKEVLVLRTCNADMTSRNDFVWPESGPVECADWDPKPRCGSGLHGLLWGDGDGGLLDWDSDAKWLVVKVAKKDIVDIGGNKVKFSRGEVVYCGNRKETTDLILQYAPASTTCVGAFVTVGDNRIATAGYGGTATAGYCGTATAGNGGTATAGYGGTATAGDFGTATAGHGGTATAGRGGTATAGEGGEIRIRYWGDNRYRTAIGYIGEDGLEPNVKYMFDVDKMKFVEV